MERQRWRSWYCATIYNLYSGRNCQVGYAFRHHKICCHTIFRYFSNERFQLTVGNDCQERYKIVGVIIKTFHNKVLRAVNTQYKTDLLSMLKINIYWTTVNFYIFLSKSIYTIEDWIANQSLCYKCNSLHIPIYRKKWEWGLTDKIYS